MLTVTYIINRFSLSVLQHKSPFKLLFNLKPSYDHLKSFNKKKFNPKTQTYTFINYPYKKKTYKLLNLSTYKIIYSKNITFHKNHFSFHHISKINSTPLPNIYNNFSNIFLKLSIIIPLHPLIIYFLHHLHPLHHILTPLPVLTLIHLLILPIIHIHLSSPSSPSFPSSLKSVKKI